MDIKEVGKLTVEERFIYFIKERYGVYLRKNTGHQRPWTDDVILRDFRFCNVRRMDDTVSDWLLQNWYRPNFDHRLMFINCVIARHFNKIETFKHIGYQKKWNQGRLTDSLRELDHPFGAAYVISGGSGRGGNYPDKISIVLDAVIQPMVDDTPIIDTNSIQKSVLKLVKYNGIGHFMAGQIVADLRWAITGKWSDTKTWAAKGPGSCRGLCRLLGQPANKAGFKQRQFNSHLKNVMDLCWKKLPKEINNRLEAIDYQNCLCEFDKYERTLHGEGRPKRKYNGRG